MDILIFDWDGTLIDSADKIVACMQAAAKEVEMPIPTDAAVRNIIGLGLPEAVDVIFEGISPEKNEAIRLQYAKHFKAADQIPCDFFPGVIDALNRFKAQGYILAIATGKSRVGLNRMLANAGLSHFFDITRCADETKSKPDPLMLKEILAAYPNKKACMVGDTEFDLGMAQALGMTSIGVSYGAHDVERLKRHDPALIIDHFSELEAWLENQTELA